MKTSKGLTLRQERFCQEFAIDLNATQAAIRAGYSHRNAGKIGSRLVGKSGVAERIRELQAEGASRAAKTRDDMIRHLESVGYGPTNIESDPRAANVRLRALELLAKLHGWIHDKGRVPVDQPVELILDRLPHQVSEKS